VSRIDAATRRREASRPKPPSTKATSSIAWR
jgi:hypothetical protein